VAAGIAGQAALVDLCRDERAHVGVHAAGLREENSPVFVQGHVVAEDVLENASAAATGMVGLGDLGKLQGSSLPSMILTVPGAVGGEALCRAAFVQVSI
jgi:hypothetical protein